MNLTQFVEAQDAVYEIVLAELSAGYKETHWIWYIFPQLAGLGTSEESKKYAVPDIESARKYLQHPVLSERLRKCCELLLLHFGEDVVDILGAGDAQKLQSSMTLFEIAEGRSGSIFGRILDDFFEGVRDSRTVVALQSD